MLGIDRNYKSLVVFGHPTRTAPIFSVLVFSACICAAQNVPASTPAGIFRHARSSVVLIVGSESGDKVAQGSGFIVGKDKIVTNCHVIAGLSAAYVLFADGHTEPVVGVAADANQDVAVLDVHTGNRLPLALGDEFGLHEGESVLAIGAPRGLELSLTNGIISAFRKSEQKFLIQNTAPIAPGSSGGPLLDSRGRVVGLTTSLLADTPGVYFSIGIDAVKRLLKAAPTVSQSFAEWAAKKGIQRRVAADTVCSFITSKMMSALPTVPTVCVVKEGDTIQYVLRVFSPTEVLEGKMRRAWSTALFLTAQALFFDGALNGTCEFSQEDKDWYGCQFDVSDSRLSENHFYYRLWLAKGTKQVMQMISDPSSDDWYRVWWHFLLASEEVSDPRFKSKGNAEWRGQDACKDYLQETPEIKLHLLPNVTCSVIFATDSTVYAVVDFPDLLSATAINFVAPLPATFGRAFSNSAYDGEVIFRSPWTVGASPIRAYETYSLRSIAFWWEEINSGVRDKGSATLLLEEERKSGQTDRYVFSSATEGKNTLKFTTAAILKIILAHDGDLLMDLSDGSEWKVRNESQSRCNLNEGTEVSILSVADGPPPSVTGEARGKSHCLLNAVFVNGW